MSEVDPRGRHTGKPAPGARRGRGSAVCRPPRWAGWLLAAVLAAASGAPREALAQAVVTTPATEGDQLIYLFDTRDDHVTYLTVANPGPEAIVVEIAVYDEALTFVTAKSLAISTWGSAFVDLLGSDPNFGSAVKDHFGLVVVTPVKSLTDSSPVTPLASLVGSFTIADETTGSAFGENALARSAVNQHEERATRGVAVDGTKVRYQQIVPKLLTIPRFLDPKKLEGTRVALAAFKDKFTDKSAFRIEPVTVSGKYSACFDAGKTSKSALFQVKGAKVAAGADGKGSELETLDEFVGDPGAGGSLYFEVDPNALAGGNFSGLFFQSLGTYGAGQRLVSVPVSTPCQGSPSSSPTPSPKPTPTGTPGICGDGKLGPGEECDGDDLNRKTCQLLVSGYPKPSRCGDPDDALRCDAQCKFVTSACRCECVKSVPCLSGACGDDGLCPVPDPS